MEFARLHGLDSFQDDYGNVMLFKKGTPGYENSSPVILQGHLDMVCEKEPDCPLDMEKDGLQLMTDGECIWAEGTTLGGDDGIAIAYILALLASEDIPHPPIEALFTCDEEIGLLGARMLDTSRLQGRRLINIDSEEEGILTVSCAGAVRIFCQIPFAPCKAQGCAKVVKVAGLLGGHSGTDINKNRQNAVKILGQLLDFLNESEGIRIASLHTGGRPNVIPSAAEAVICFDPEKSDGISRALESFSIQLKQEYAETEPNISALLGEAPLPASCLDPSGTQDLIFTLIQAPTGVYSMNPHIPDLVQTSLNFSSADMEENLLELSFMVRSNTDFGKQVLVRQLTLLIGHLGGNIRLEGDYSAWEYARNSALRDQMVQAYQDIYGTLPKVQAIHAGLECGILSDRLPGTDMVSFGPDMENVHTSAERMDVESVKRCWHYLLHVLELLK